MSKLQFIKEKVQREIENNTKYEIQSIKSIEHPLNKTLMSFNIIFSDSEKSIRYSLVGYENEIKEIGILLEASFLTGIEEDLEESKEIDDFKVEIRNFKKGKEALVKLSFRGNPDKFDFYLALNTLIEEGINKLIY
ncbi:MAG: hypothetical protein N2486_09655 [Caloramator sp.]|nr:hypothetical protein [Caloramator sp.]